MSKIKNNYIGDPDDHLIWNRVTDLHREVPIDLHREVPIDVSQPQTQLPGLSNTSFEALDASSDEDDDMQYIQDCLSEVLEGIPRRHTQRDGKKLFSLSSKEKEASRPFSYFGIRVDQDTCFRDTGTLAKILSSNPKKGPLRNASQTSKPSHDSLQSPKGKCMPHITSEQQDGEPHPKMINKHNVLELRDINSHKAFDLRIFLNNRLNNDQKSSAKLSNTQISNDDCRMVKNLWENVQYSVPKSKQDVSLIEKESAEESTGRDSRDVHLSPKDCQEISSAENSKEVSAPDLSSEIQMKRKLLSVLGTSEGHMPKEEEDSNNNSCSKQTSEYSILPEKSDLDVAYETVTDVDLSVTFQNMSMNEEDLVGLNNSNYIILDETLGSVDEVSIAESTSVLLKKEAPKTQSANSQELELIVEDVPELITSTDIKLDSADEEVEFVIKNQQEEICEIQKPEPKAVAHESPEKILVEEVALRRDEYEAENKREIIKSRSEVVTEAQQVEESQLVFEDARNEGLEPEPVKAYMLPFISDNPEENKDNEDPRWNYMAKLQTDEERYQLCRKLWKSLVVPDPNVNLTYFGHLKHQRNDTIPGNDQGHSSQGQTSRKRQREQDESHSEPPRKKARGIVNLNFSQRSIERRKSSVTRDYYKDLHMGKYYYNRARLEKAYFEKMEQLRLAQAEIIARHNFYLGLPDQTASISQAEVEQELRDIEEHYEKYKHIYRWTERSLFV
ncbi:uncharacterized protein LOC122261638 [Penaeus japonicus]|uniref:uncharacterized protein LOC122261638 n=1 Tax=Penaeus japonicus TaxID=27405 RepID=UPI001C711038|nr:uncharacterized protein LOC122261638 [Penaeus japonicus]